MLGRASTSATPAA